MLLYEHQTICPDSKFPVAQKLNLADGKIVLIRTIVNKNKIVAGCLILMEMNFQDATNSKM
jgi:hypothetical protein